MTRSNVVGLHPNMKDLLAKDADFVQKRLREDFLVGPTEELTPDHVDKVMKDYMIGGPDVVLLGDSEVRCDIQVTETLGVVNLFEFVVDTDKPQYVLDHFYIPLLSSAPAHSDFVPKIAAEGNRLIFRYTTERFSRDDMNQEKMREDLLALSADHRHRIAHADVLMREAAEDVLRRDEMYRAIIERQRVRYERATTAKFLLDEMRSNGGVIQMAVA